jgi:hypothetical protein
MDDVLTFTIGLPSLSELSAEELERYAEVLNTTIETLEAEHLNDANTPWLGERFRRDLQVFVEVLSTTATLIQYVRHGRRPEVSGVH